MMKVKPFWDNLVEIREIRIKLDEHGLGRREKKKLLKVAYQTFDIRIMEIILTHLPEEKKQNFLNTFSRKPHQAELMASLKEDIADIEEKISALAKEVKKEILDQLE